MPSGFLAVVMALRICDSLSLYGFSMGRGPSMYYYERSPPDIAIAWTHEIRKEYEVYQKLHDEGVLNWIK
jgi:hypothetical protein